MDNIIVLVGKFTRLCIAIIKIFFSVVVTLMVLWAMQRLNMLPVFERCERGVLTPDNPDWEGYWQSQGLIPSCNADLEEDTLITNFGLVLQTLIDSECRQVMSLHGNMDHIPLQGFILYYTVYSIK